MKLLSAQTLAIALTGSIVGIGCKPPQASMVPISISKVLEITQAEGEDNYDIVGEAEVKDWYWGANTIVKVDHDLKDILREKASSLGATRFAIVRYDRTMTDIRIRAKLYKPRSVQ